MEDLGPTISRLVKEHGTAAVRHAMDFAEAEEYSAIEDLLDQTTDAEVWATHFMRAMRDIDMSVSTVWTWFDAALRVGREHGDRELAVHSHDDPPAMVGTPKPPARTQKPLPKLEDHMYGRILDKYESVIDDRYRGCSHALVLNGETHHCIGEEGHKPDVHVAEAGQPCRSCGRRLEVHSDFCDRPTEQSCGSLFMWWTVDEAGVVAFSQLPEYESEVTEWT